MSSVRFLTGVSACVSTSGNHRVCCLRPEWARWQGGTQTARNQQAETGKDRAEKPSRVISVEHSGPLNENSSGDHLGQELKRSELNEGEKVETIKMSL